MGLNVQSATAFICEPVLPRRAVLFHCGSCSVPVFEPRRGPTPLGPNCRTCTDNALRRAWHEARKTPPPPCEICNGPVKPKSGKTRWCAGCQAEGQRRASKARREKVAAGRPALLPILCARCAAVFVPRQTTDKYCPGGACKPHCECVYCGINYAPRRLDTKGMFCSRDCSFAWLKQKAAERKAALSAGRICRISFCVDCSATVRGARRRCEECAAKKAYYVPRSALVETPCKVCDRVFEQATRQGGKSAFCSEECRSLERRRVKGITRRREKALKRRVTAESVDPVAVFNRDKWKCQLCGVLTLKRLRGKHEPRSPELDHIIPLSQGGEHSYINTQCACRACNGRKGAQPLGQLRMFG